MKQLLFAVLFYSACTSAQVLSDVPITGTNPSKPVTPAPAVSESKSATAAPKPSKTVNQNHRIGTPVKPVETVQFPPPSQESKDFHSAILHGNLQMAELLFRQGADVNCLNCGNPIGVTPLLYAASSPYVSGGQQAMLSWLLGHGADINLQSFPQKKSPIMLLASYTDSADALSYMLQAGANVMLKDVNGATALHYLSLRPIADSPYYSPASNPHTKWLRNLRQILAGGLSINATNDEGVTPLMLAVSQACLPGIVRDYLSLGADASIKNAAGETAASMAYKRAIASNDSRCNEAYTLLSAAASNSAARGNGGSGSGSDRPALAGASGLGGSIAGEWIGYIKVKSPSQATVPVSGSISASGQVLLSAQTGVTTTGQVETVGNDGLTFLLKSKAPAGKTFVDGTTEGAEFRVDATRSGDVIRGSYISPIETGDFFLCTRGTYQSNAACRGDAMAGTGNPLKDLGNALDSINKVLSGLGKKQ